MKQIGTFRRLISAWQNVKGLLGLGGGDALFSMLVWLILICPGVSEPTDGVPAAQLGLSSVTLSHMQWAVRDCGYLMSAGCADCLLVLPPPYAHLPDRFLHKCVVFIWNCSDRWVNVLPTIWGSWLRNGFVWAHTLCVSWAIWHCSIIKYKSVMRLDYREQLACLTGTVNSWLDGKIQEFIVICTTITLSSRWQWNAWVTGSLIAMLRIITSRKNIE